MRHKFLIIAAVSTGLASCGPGVDEPTNIPLLGQWTDTQEVISISADGVAMDVDTIPSLGGITKNEGPKCMEPKLRTNEEFRDALSGTKLGQCDPQLTTAGGNITVKGSCSAGIIGGGDIKASFTGSGTQSADEASLTLTIDVYQGSDSGETNYATVKMRKKMKRVGDC
jgi:hypothetical protein